jgi:outer membrane protein assembly factor BamB
MKTRSIFASVLTLAVLAVLASPAAGDDWPRWRGPAGNGISAESDWDPAALDPSARILWKANVGMGHSAVAVRGGLLYAMGNRQVTSGPHAGEHEDVVYCLDAETGREVWHYAYPCKDGQDPGPGSSPALDGELLYTFGREGQLIAFNASDGSIRWRRDVAAGAAPSWGFAGSPLIEGDMVLLDAGKSGYAVDKHTGKIIWASELEECGFSTPAVFSLGEQRLAAIAARSKVYVIDIASGDQLWSHECQAINDPIAVGNRLLLSGAGRAAELVQLGADEPEVIWSQRGLLGHYANPVIIGDYVFGIGRARRTYHLQCADLRTGELKWSKEIGEWGALIAAAGKLIVIDDFGKLLIVDAVPDAYRLISSAKVLEMADNTGVDNRRQCHCWTAPALADGLVYVRNTYGELACVDLRSGQARINPSG